MNRSRPCVPACPGDSDKMSSIDRGGEPSTKVSLVGSVDGKLEAGSTPNRLTVGSMTRQRANAGVDSVPRRRRLWVQAIVYPERIWSTPDLRDQAGGHGCRIGCGASVGNGQILSLRTARCRLGLPDLRSRLVGGGYRRPSCSGG